MNQARPNCVYLLWLLASVFHCAACLCRAFHFKGKFRFNWLFDEVKRTPIGLGALIRGENVLLEG